MLEVGTSWRLASPLISQTSSFHYTTLHCTTWKWHQSQLLFVLARRSPESLQESCMAVARSEVTELVLSISDGILESGISLACHGGSCQRTWFEVSRWRPAVPSTLSRSAWGDCGVFRRLIFHRFPFQGKNNTLTSISNAASQQASRKNELHS